MSHTAKALPQGSDLKRGTNAAAELCLRATFCEVLGMEYKNTATPLLLIGRQMALLKHLIMTRMFVGCMLLIKLHALPLAS